MSNTVAEGSCRWPSEMSALRIAWPDLHRLKGDPVVDWAQRTLDGAFLAVLDRPGHELAIEHVGRAVGRFVQQHEAVAGLRKDLEHVVEHVFERLIDVVGFARAVDDGQQRPELDLGVDLDPRLPAHSHVEGRDHGGVDAGRLRFAAFAADPAAGPIAGRVEGEQRVVDLDLILVGQDPHAAEPLGVDEGAVEAAEIFDHEAVFAAGDAGVLPRDARGRQHDIARQHPAKQSLLGGQFVDFAALAARLDDQSGEFWLRAEIEFSPQRRFRDSGAYRQYIKPGPRRVPPTGGRAGGSTPWGRDPA